MASDGAVLSDQENLLEKARLLLQRERELFELRLKFEQLAVWLAVGQALPELFMERGRSLPQLLDRVRKLLIGKLRLQRVLTFEVVPGELRPLAPGGDPRVFSDEARASFDAQAGGVCNDAQSFPLVAEAVGLDRFMWSRIQGARAVPILLVAGFDRAKAAFQSPFGDNDLGYFSNATRQIEALLGNYLLVGELEREKEQLERTNLTLGERDRELSQATDELRLANETLEQRVRDRTAELGSKNRELRLVFDNVDQGLVMIDLEGHMAVERSRRIDGWFGAAHGAPRLFEYLAADRRFAEALDVGLEALRDDFLPREVCLAQLPETLRIGARHFKCRYLPIEEADVWVSLLLVIDDITEQLTRDREEAEQRELLAAFSGLMRDRTGFLRFMEESEQMLAELVHATTTDTRQKQLLHTLKGNAATLGLQVVADLCHLNESEFENLGSLRPESRERLRARWDIVAEALRKLAPTGLQKMLELSEVELKRLTQRARDGASALQIVQELEHLRWEPVSRIVDRLGQQAHALALRLGKGDVHVQTESDDLRLDPDRWGPLWSALIHVVRNAVDHGLEAAPERRAAGKSERGRLRLSARRQAESFRLEISDDGRGVDWARVRELCHARGKPADTPADLTDALLSPGFSTKDEVTETSGRGVGLAAVAYAVRELSGAVSIESDAKQGTSWVLTFPFAFAARSPSDGASR
jgi:HPt (histidine-containing phosphotransfer) domain-containing protein